MCLEFSQTFMIIHFLIDDGSEKAFSIAADSGVIKTIKKLDREQKASYQLIVIATDQGETKQLNSSVYVYIDLIDAQDSSPMFEKQLYNFSVNENSNSEVGTVTATLADEDFVETLSYSIVTDPFSLFVIDRKRGTIRVRTTLDYEKENFYTLVVRVRVDSGKYNETTVYVHVNDVNDHRPILTDFYIFLNIIDGKFDPNFKVPAYDPDVTSVLKYRIISGNDYNVVYLDPNTGYLTLEKSIGNQATETTIKVEVLDGKYAQQAFGRISVSQVSYEMISSSLFIVLQNTTKETFLQVDVLRKFKNAIASALSSDSRRIFILSVENFKIDNSNITPPMLEVAIAVREEVTEKFIHQSYLKDLLYLNQEAFVKELGINIVSFDYWDDYFCSAEICDNFEYCSVKSKNRTIFESNTINSQNVIFRGISIKMKFSCTCPIGFRDGPVKQCADRLNLCYQKPCGDHGKCIGLDSDYVCICDKDYTGKFPAKIYLFKITNRSTRKRCEICLKLTIQTLERPH